MRHYIAYCAYDLPEVTERLGTMITSPASFYALYGTTAVQDGRLRYSAAYVKSDAVDEVATANALHMLPAVKVDGVTPVPCDVRVLEFDGDTLTGSTVEQAVAYVEPLYRIGAHRHAPTDGDIIADGCAPYNMQALIGRDVRPW